MPTDGKIAATERNLPNRLRDAAITGRIHQAATTSPAIFYTDGSVSRHRIGRNLGWMTGWGYLATDGRYGCGKYPQFTRRGGHDQTIPVVTELRAIWHAIGDQLAAGPITVITDSREVLVHLDRWKSGSLAMPAGYVGGRKRPTLERLRLAVTAHPDRLTVHQTTGHAGDVLNEAADTLAQLGMRWARDDLNEDTVTSRAEGIAEGFLADYRRRQ